MFLFEATFIAKFRIIYYIAFIIEYIYIWVFEIHKTHQVGFVVYRR